MDFFFATSKGLKRKQLYWWSKAVTVLKGHCLNCFCNMDFFIISNLLDKVINFVKQALVSESSLWQKYHYCNWGHFFTISIPSNKQNDSNMIKIIIIIMLITTTIIVSPFIFPHERDLSDLTDPLAKFLRTVKIINLLLLNYV